MKENIKAVGWWLIMSSADPTKYSATIKGIGLGTIPVIIALTGVTGAHFDSDTLTSLVDTISSIVQISLTLIATAWSLYGILRKGYLTFVGENHQPKE